ncbi:unnamed protein product [Adineta steineri]|uniref:G-protein coupled receptors family 1 profile domain-containing protein n=4 Tax=Adineta steineri TaxID=433720 RepID=A0A818ILW4_9BILA|nr:unnamed protein product [Adineta steineri]CAF1355894.1 unnamed protein product [Adineta steineri]CAF3522001.1 unnamed protein product [Adineta steineri]
MNCTEEFQRKNYSGTTLNYAMDDDAGSWWWWTNIIGTLCFGGIGLIGNTICFLVVCRFALPQHSFVQYLRALAIFDFFSLLFECFQSLNSLLVYLFSINILHFRSSIICKIYEYSNHVCILLACWTIVGLTFDRLILLCDPWSKQCPNLSRKICNLQCAKKIIFFLIFLALIINLPHLIYQQWVCRQSGYRFSAAFNAKNELNLTLINNKTTNHSNCQCRISPEHGRFVVLLFVQWKIYVFHLFCYTLLPAVILIASNAAILQVLHAPRQIVGQQNEHIRSKLTRTLTSVSLMFLVLYFPHAIVETLSLILIPSFNMRCAIRSIIIFRVLKRLSELLNIAALGINFFLYILGVNHYRSAAIQMLGLHHFDIFLKYLTVEHRNSIGSIALHTHNSNRRNTTTDASSIKLLKVINNGTNNGSPTLSGHRTRFSR